MQRFLLLVISLLILTGCSSGGPVSPDIQYVYPPAQKTQSIYDERYRLWGEWTWYIPETHDRIDVIPHRRGYGHMNVLKLLEEDCNDCVEIVSIHNNGDSTIDVQVRIKHPKPTEPQYTGFDVKGILMFNGSVELWAEEKLPPYQDTMIISWREFGDPEVLNPDGYAVRWSPSYDSGSELPLLNYWKGKYATETEPNATMNAYLDFYTTEDRHMFSVNGSVTKTYHIFLPPGPVVAGYSVEACWVPPDKMPVTDPIEDFPVTANQAEPYHFTMVINNGEPITQPDCCGWDCSDLWMEIEQWSEMTIGGLMTIKPEPNFNAKPHAVVECPDKPGFYALTPVAFSYYPEGKWRGYCVAFDPSDQPDYKHFAYSVMDWTVE